ncbi:hypothetical protein QL285_045590 [Trifolium repens]|nr:hypothetical protein QL285_045590 [Trifolium repens]
MNIPAIYGIAAAQLKARQKIYRFTKGHTKLPFAVFVGCLANPLFHEAFSVLKASTMLYSGGCDFGDEGDGPRAWCGHMLPAVVTSAQSPELQGWFSKLIKLTMLQ